MPIEQSKNVDPKSLATPFVLVGALFVAVLYVAKWGLRAEMACWVVFVLGLQVWALAERRRLRRQIRSQIERMGCKVIKMESRALSLGPFSMWNTSRTQDVLRIVVEEPSGRERIVWARWGRRWFWNPAMLELKWQEPPSVGSDSLVG